MEHRPVRAVVTKCGTPEEGEMVAQPAGTALTAKVGFDSKTTAAKAYKELNKIRRAFIAYS
jgi:hypothetical protein